MKRGSDWRRRASYAALDSRIALNQLEQATAAWRASAGTAEQAQRALEIDQLRYREGISTQTDLSQSRLLVEQAVANRAVAARNLAVARLRLQLLTDLPLQLGGTSGSTQTQQPPSTDPQDSGSTGNAGAQPNGTR